MKTRILTLSLALLALSSCSTMYKSGQTPDDVYFSPGAERSGYVDNDRNGGYDDGYVDLNDRYLRMKSSGRRWSTFDDDFMYWNNPSWNNQFMFNAWNRPVFGWGMGSMGMGSMWGNPYFGMGSMFMHDPFFGFNSFYGSPFSPFYYGTPVVIINNPKPMPSNPRANGPRTFNLNTYTPSGSNYTDPRTGKNVYMSNPGNGNSGIRVFSNSGSNGSERSGGYINTESSRPRGGYNSDYYNNSGSRSSSPSRTFESMGNSGNSGGGAGSNSGGSSGSAPVRSFPRGGGN
jgi:hypothetical protein